MPNKYQMTNTEINLGRQSAGEANAKHIQEERMVLQVDTLPFKLPRSKTYA